MTAASVLLRGGGEVDWRNAASRAYYAAHHRCRRLAHDEGLALDQVGSAHAGVVDALGQMGNARPLRELAGMLDRCRLRRRDADYEIEKAFARGLANAVVEDCGNILTKADAF
ncbi:MAG: hypothetical protein OXG44_10440 [Gammaproteobacteria bacterium]|nr:hypothetical protein [Gammaproteobacteria bacterium]